MSMASLTLEVTNVTTRINGTIPLPIFKEIDLRLSYEVEGYFFSDAYKRAYWDGRKRLISKNTFPTGVLRYVCEILNAHQIPFSLQDLRVAPPLGDPLPIYDIKLYDYQDDAVEKSINKQRGIIRVATGGGKSLIASAIAGKLNIPTLILTHRETLALQMKENLEKYLRVSVGMLGAGVKETEKFTVGMVQTLSNKKYDSLVQNIPCLIIDEVHHAPATTIFDLHKLAKNAYYRFGLTATNWRDDNSGILIEAATAPPIVEIGASTLIERGLLTKPYIYFIKVPKIPELEQRAYQTVYSQGIVNNTERNILIAYLCNYLAVRKKKILVAVNLISHGDILLGLIQSRYPKINSVFVQGKDEAEVKYNTLKELNDGDRQVVIATTIFGEGVNIPNLDVLVNAKGAKSSVDTFQLVGRVIRKTDTKNSALIIDFLDQTKYLKSHANARLKILRTEPSYEIKIVDTIEQIEIRD